MGASVSFKLLGAGWAECHVELGGQSAAFFASYLSHPLEDLLRAMIDLLRGVPESAVVLADEPGASMWHVRRLPEGRVTVRIVECDEWRGDRTVEGREVLLDAECRLRTLAGSLLATAQEVYREHGKEGYRRDWGKCAFPMHELVELKRLLETGAGR